MKLLKLQSLIFCLLIIIASHAFSGDEDWGKVSKEILNLKVFEKDSSADAIILFDKGEFRITDDFQLKVIMHRRMKIFNEEGKDVANIEIEYDKTSSKILELKAQTILPSGKKIEVKDFYDEKVGNFWHQKKFTFPGVENGAVVEYKVVILTDNLFHPPVWHFQHEYYTLKSELVFRVKQGFVFSVNYINPLFLDLKPIKEEITTPGWGKATLYKWVVEDIPPFEEEPYMGSRKDYLTSLMIQFQEYRDGGFHYTFVKNWKDINKNLLKDYKEFYNADNQIKEILQSMNLDSLQSEEKIKKIYDYVREEIETDGGYSLYSYKTAKEILEKKKAISSDKNLLLSYLLNMAGFQAYPMLISSRAHGHINAMWPGLRNFNRLIVYLKDGFKTYYLDASYDNLPYYLTAPQNIVEAGFVVGEGQGNLLALKKNRKKARTTISESFTVNEDGDLIGKCSIKFQDYAAYNRRKALRDKSPEELVKSMLEDIFTDFEIDTAYVENKKNLDEPLYLKFVFTVPEYMEETGDKVYITLPLLSAIRKNPFRSEKRHYPVIFSYPAQIKEVAKFSFPDSYSLADLPKPQVAVIPKAAKYKLKFVAQGNEVLIKRDFTRTENNFSVGKYPALKEFYAKCINGDNVQIILQEKENSLSKTSE